MGKYKKRKDGRYSTSVIANGKKKYIYGKTIAEVDMKLSQIKTDTSRGTYADDKGLTVKQWADKWMQTYKADKSYNTWQGYSNIIRNHITEIHDIRLKDLCESDIQLCINKANGHYDIQRRIKNTMIQMLKKAINDGLIYKNVATDVSIPKKPKTNTRALNDREKAAIGKCDFTTEERCFVCLLRYTGMRPEEARALTKNDIDFSRMEITINKAVAFERNQAILTTPKTENGYRTIPILAPLEAILRGFCNELDSLYLFTQNSGNLHTKTTYRRFWKKIFDKINAELGGTDKIKATDLTPYVFRHDFATTLYYSGIDIKEAARIMGHADTKMMLEVYAELDSAKSNSADKLNKYIKEVAK